MTEGREDAPAGRSGYSDLMNLLEIDVYEYLLSKLSTAGVNGQFRTPRHIIRMMVDLMQPAPDEVICDIKTPMLIQFNYSTAAYLQAG